MGTRADFYVGRGESAEWIGSIAFDGYPEGIDNAVRQAVSEADYRSAVAMFFDGRRDVTLPADGWPWPWETSRTTDFAYAFDGGVVWGSCFGGAWFRAISDEAEDGDGPDAVFPVFSHDRAAPAGSDRSGIMVVTAPAGDHA